MKPYTITLGGELDYGKDLTKWLNGDTITGVTWSISPAFDLVNPTFDATSLAAFVKPNGAAVIGSVCILTALIVTAAGRRDERTFSITVTRYR